MRVLLVFGQHFKRTENGQPGADQREELLIEDKKGFQLDLAPLQAAKTGAGADAEDVVAGVGKAGAQLVGRGRRLHLLLHAAALVRDLDDEFRHATRRRSILSKPDLSGRLFSGFLLRIKVISSRPLCL